jgi:hypothetical protein
VTARAWAEVVADYEDAWNEADPAAMREKLRALFNADARVFDPVFPTEMKLEDYGNLIEHMRAREPDNIVRFEDPQASAGIPWARATWRVIEPGMKDFTGTIVVELDHDARIRTLVSFFDREAEQPAEGA